MKKLTKTDKILYTITLMECQSKRLLKYEDVIVKVYESFPKDFQIRNYPQYPDSDTIRRAMYSMIPQGLLRIKNRNCTLTKSGREKGNKLIMFINGDTILVEARKDSNFDIEIKRLLRLEGFIMYRNKDFQNIIDQDFYDFYKATVRTNSLELIGKMKQVNDLVKKYSQEISLHSKELFEYSRFLKSNFKYIYEGEK